MVNFLARLFRPPELTHPESSTGPRIALFGDSHTAALQAAKAYPDRSHVYEHVRIHRLRKTKNGKDVGDTDLQEFCDSIRNFAETDFVYSAVGGNQYAVVSTVRSPLEYDVLTSPDDGEMDSPDLTLVPFRALASHIERGIRGSLGPVLREIRNSTRARVLHLAPPPPKKSNDFISRHFESRFAKQGLGDLGPTRPELRLKCWKLQNDALARLCDEIGVELVQPPWRTVTPEGYLAERCYANDVTHGNRRYGEYVLKDILMMTGTSYVPEGKRA
jgi:hypothetical protein